MINRMVICLQEVVNKRETIKQKFVNFGLEEIAIKMMRIVNISMK
jgi:hypothetical protein